jgi:ComF family protein
MLMHSTFSNHFASPFRSLLNVVLPPLCPSCSKPVMEQGGLCAECYQQLRFISQPWCATLGTPFSYDLGPDALSAEAIANPPPFRRLRASVHYDDVARRIVHAFKYQRKTHYADLMAQWMSRAGHSVLADCEVIVPVPLHKWRLWRRGFNQSVLLAQALHRLSEKPVDFQSLQRIRPTRQQVGLTMVDRMANVRGAFQVARDRKHLIQGRNILLIDDVYTAGATAKACTKALLQAGAKSVDVLVFARVIDEPLH